MTPRARTSLAIAGLLGLAALGVTAGGVALAVASQSGPTPLDRALAAHHDIPLALASGIGRTARQVKTRSEWLAAVMDLETDGTFSPSIRNPTSKATGLIGFTNKTARRLGTTTNELAEMTAIEQLPYVRKYLDLVRSGQWPDDPRAMPLDTFHRLMFSVFWLPGRDKGHSFPLPEHLRAGNEVTVLGDYHRAVEARMLPGGALA